MTPRTRFLLPALLVLLAAVVGCQNGPTIFGYRAGADALYDPNIKTVYVPVFSNRAFQTTPYRGFEVDVTKAVVREIGAKTPFRVVSDPGRADTELLGNVVGIDKNVLNRNQQNLTREAEIVVTVDVLWRDLRNGCILSTPKRVAPGSPAEPPPVFDPTVPAPPMVAEELPAIPVRIVATGRVIPELGESNASGSKRVQDAIATQIVSMMERPW